MQAEDAGLLPRRAVPASADHEWDPEWYVAKIGALERDIDKLRTRIAEVESESAERERYALSLRELVNALEQDAAKRERYVTDIQEHLDRCQEWATVLERKVRRFEQHLGGATVGVLVLSIAFGLGHYVQGWDAVITTGALGAFWAVLYLRRRSSVAAMVSHAGFNSAEVLRVALLG